MLPGPVLFNTLVRPDSPLQTLRDLKKLKNPVVGIAVGSHAEFYFIAACKANGLEIGGDVTLKNVPPSVLVTMPAGLDAVVLWDLFTWDLRYWLTARGTLRGNPRPP